MRPPTAKCPGATFTGCLGVVSANGLDPQREKSVVTDKREEDNKEYHAEEARQQPHRVRLPGFLIEEEIGLGDAIKRITYAMGIKACGSCDKRARALNQWVHFTRQP